MLPSHLLRVTVRVDPVLKMYCCSLSLCLVGLLGALLTTLQWFCLSVSALELKTRVLLVCVGSVRNRLSTP